jgi:hypothetical protein
MVKKIDSSVLTIVLCGALGVVLGATASQAEMNQCLTAANPSHQCLTQDPVMKRVEGMSMGFFAGAGAAIGATWQMKRKG